MTNNELVKKYYNEVTGIFAKLSIPEDLQQHFWLEFLQKDNKLLNELDQKKELLYYIIGWLRKQLYSKTSSYYKTYNKYYEKILNIEGLEEWI